MRTNDSFLPYLCVSVSALISKLPAESLSRITEIRMRSGKPLYVKIIGRERQAGGGFAPASIDEDFNYIVTPQDIAETVERMSRHSLYAFESALRMGYMTLPGGHRAGVAGQAVPVAQDKPGLRTLTHISGINLRVAHDVKGCADEVLPAIFEGGNILHTLIVSPPACGKTTLLRDIVRSVSDGGLNVGLVDERSEVAGCYRGVPQNDVGLRTDVLDGCPKAEGMVMLLRAMSPDVIAVDELGGERDARAVSEVLNAGVKLVCTAHGRDVEGLKKNPMLKELTARGVFERFVVLAGPGRVAGVYDGGGADVR